MKYGIQIPNKIINTKDRKKIFDRFDLNEKLFTIGVFSRIEEQKGQHLVVEALNSIDNKDIQLLIIGHCMDNKYLDKLNNMIDEFLLRLAKKDLESGRLYVRLRKYNAALTYFNSILLEYYDTEYNDDAIYYSILTYLKMEDLDSANKFLLSNKNNFYNKSNYDKVQNIIDNY